MNDYEDIDLHKKRQKLHAIKRARQRFGVDLTERMYRAIVRNIKRSKKAKYIKDGQVNTRSVWYIRLRGIPAFAVYDQEYQTIVTFFETRRSKSVMERMGVQV